MPLGSDADDNAMARDDTASEKTFDFFSLARELRDAIYDDILAGTTLPVNQEADILVVNMFNAPRVGNLLVNRQFRDELLERSRKRTYIEMRQSLNISPCTSRIPSNLAFTHCKIHFKLDDVTPYRFGTELHPYVLNNLVDLIDPVHAKNVLIELDLYIDKEAVAADYIRFLRGGIDSVSDNVWNNFTEKLFTSIKLWQWQESWNQRGEVKLLATRAVPSY